MSFLHRNMVEAIGQKCLKDILSALKMPVSNSLSQFLTSGFTDLRDSDGNNLLKSENVESRAPSLLKCKVGLCSLKSPYDISIELSFSHKLLIVHVAFEEHPKN